MQDIEILTEFIESGSIFLNSATRNYGWRFFSAAQFGERILRDEAIELAGIRSRQQTRLKRITAIYS